MRVFVYGTLLSGEPNHAALAGARFAGAAETAPAFELVDLGPYPALVAGGATRVRGEVYDVDEATLAALDAFEGHPDLYVRIRVTLADGTEAIAYAMPRARVAGRPRIASGDWRRRRG